MARIRSIHPGINTDEAYMSASFGARLLIVSLWMEAYDDGVFEWKPLTLKARIFPADHVDMSALLDELMELRFITWFEVDGRPYGAIRNFQKYQRPKKPNSSGVLPDSLRPYVAAKPASSEPVPNQSGTSTPKSPQMEDGGGRMEKKEVTPPHPSDALPPTPNGEVVALRPSDDPPSRPVDPDGGGETPSPIDDSPPKPPPRRGTRIAPDWEPSAKDRDFARTEGLSEHEIDRTADKFRDHWLESGRPNAVKRDWAAAWRNWVRRDRDGRPSGGGAGPSPGFAAGGHRREPPSLMRAALRVAAHSG